VTVLLVLAATLLAWFFLRRANELSVIEVRNGDARLTRGRAPGRLLFDIGEIARRAAIERATLRIVSEGGSPRLEVFGTASPTEIQQLRNVVGEHRVLHFRTGRRPHR
jgi:hypothetical protein